MFNSGGFQHSDGLSSSVTVAGVDATPVRMDMSPAAQETAHDPVWVIYASETGVAEHLARDTCRTLQDAGVVSRLLPFDALDLDTLQTVNDALFLVSTCYDGDPPDMAEEFCREHMRNPVQLLRLRYGLLALGDSYYDEFCGFGRRLQQWLQVSGAQALFELVEMDDEDEVAARCWHDRVGAVVRWRRHAGDAAL
ncbi:MAG TPA: flavodoxin domain-containing protein [Rhodanobacter sp.]|nr:flavodoxin domain-containing protein [Rhodanobacter sp.]